MISPEIIQEYNNGRSHKSALCHAPFTNLRFYQSGDAFACAINAAHILGTYPRDSIREIWFGEKAEQLREALKNNDLSLGCHWCKRELESHYFGGPKSTFDYLIALRTARQSSAPLSQRLWNRFTGRSNYEFPVAIEFSLGNQCNLECVMCRGFFSSAICRNQENREPSVPPYDLAFIDQVEEFLPHLSLAQFSGGEPFLIDLHYEVWDRIRRVNPRLEIHITTNGTILNRRVKTVLENLNCRLILSIDSMEKETYEAIRRNASYEKVMRNTEYFMDYSARRGHSLIFAACVMKQNWMDIPHLVDYCSRRNIMIWFNMVYTPLAHSLSTMDAVELTEIINYWRKFNLKANDWLSAQNRDRYIQVIERVEQWRKDALEENASLFQKLGLGKQEIDTSQEMDQVFSSIASISKDADHKAGESLNKGQREYLYRKLVELREEPFLSSYFHALGYAYESSHHDSSQEEKSNTLTKIDRFHHRFGTHYGRDCLVMVLVETDIRDVFEWLEGNPPEMMRRFLNSD